MVLGLPSSRIFPGRQWNNLWANILFIGTVKAKWYRIWARTKVWWHTGEIYTAHSRSPAFSAQASASLHLQTKIRDQFCHAKAKHIQSVNIQIHSLRLHGRVPSSLEPYICQWPRIHGRNVISSHHRFVRYNVKLSSPFWAKADASKAVFQT